MLITIDGKNISYTTVIPCIHLTPVIFVKANFLQFDVNKTFAPIFARFLVTNDLSVGIQDFYSTVREKL